MSVTAAFTARQVLLYTTIAVSAVHLLFDMLAFKNDLSFWSQARRRAAGRGVRGARRGASRE